MDIIVDFISGLKPSLIPDQEVVRQLSSPLLPTLNGPTCEHAVSLSGVNNVAAKIISSAYLLVVDCVFLFALRRNLRLRRAFV